jgi:hypothetical protein
MQKQACPELVGEKLQHRPGSRGYRFAPEVRARQANRFAERPEFCDSYARDRRSAETMPSSSRRALPGRWLGLLKEVAPLLARVAVIFNPETGPFSPLFLRAVEMAAPSFAVKPIATPVHDAADIERAISAFAHDLNGGLIVLPSAFVAVHRQLIFEQAAQHRLPAVYGFRYFAADGGLMSYGVDVPDLFRRSAAYIDRILKGGRDFRGR